MSIVTRGQRPTGVVVSRPVLAWSVTMAVLATLASVLGLVDPDFYAEETENWATQAQGQDIGNLLAVATLLLSGRCWSQGSRGAGVVWVGTLLYLVYAYVVYAMAVHFNALFLVYVAVLGLSSYAVMWSVGRLRAEHRTEPRRLTCREASRIIVLIRPERRQTHGQKLHIDADPAGPTDRATGLT